MNKKKKQLTSPPGLLSPARRMGNFLTWLRKDFGIASQLDFAKRLAIGPSYMSNIEGGRTPMKLKTAWDICRLLDIHPDFLISCGSGGRAPFPALEPDAQARAAALIAASGAANFVDAWPAVRDVLFATAPAPEEDADVEAYADRIAARIKRLAKQPDAKATLARVIAALKL